MRLGTRGSALALAQARAVAARITALAGVEVELVTIRTGGDRDAHASLAAAGDIGFFTKEIEHELLAGRIDVAVHSFKDLPVAMTGGLALAAVPEREDPADVLIARDALTLATLPPGARVATSSPRRRAQLLAARRDLEIVEIRGNVETRLARLDSGAFDALVLARAGLARLGLAARATERLSPEPLVPAPGQGALAVQVRADDAATLAALAPIDDARARAETAAERAFLEALGGGCRVPIGATARQSGDGLALLGWISDPDAITILRDEMQGDAARPSELGRRLASHLLERGASHVLSGASRGRA
jgi:hydroxymethylbilane synthase